MSDYSIGWEDDGVRKVPFFVHTVKGQKRYMTIADAAERLSDFEARLAAATTLQRQQEQDMLAAIERAEAAEATAAAIRIAFEDLLGAQSFQDWWLQRVANVHAALAPDAGKALLARLERAEAVVQLAATGGDCPYQAARECVGAQAGVGKAKEASDA